MAGEVTTLRGAVVATIHYLWIHLSMQLLMGKASKVDAPRHCSKKLLVWFGAHYKHVSQLMDVSPILCSSFCSFSNSTCFQKCALDFTHGIIAILGLSKCANSHG
jgi:hypothetical protein